jgi:hypothetical protein
MRVQCLLKKERRMQEKHSAKEIKTMSRTERMWIPSVLL